MSITFTPARHHIPTDPATAGWGHEGEKKGEEKVALDDMFNQGRMRKNVPLWQWVLFGLYLPLGMLVMVTRLLVWAMLCMAVLVLPRFLIDSVVRPLTKLACGIVVKHNYKGVPLSDDIHIITGNHVSDWDAVVTWMIMPRFHTLTAAHLKLIPVVGRVYKRLGAIFVTPTPEGRAEVKAKVQDIIKVDPHPILIFPEGGLTNGKAGTMMYHRFVFSLDCVIIPLAISLKNPWPVTHDYLGSTWARNFFWFLTVPFHVYEYTFLPAQTRNEDETQEEFAYRIQKMTSDYVKLETTGWKYSDKKELWKQISEGKRKWKSE